MPSLYEIDGGILRLNLHPGQTRAWDSTARIVGVIAGTQSGKTSFGPWWLEREIQRGGKGDYIAATSSYDLFKLKMLPELREVFEHVLQIGRYWSGDKVIELINPETGKFEASRADDRMWGRIILRSAASSGGLESATGKAAWLDEFGQDDVPLTAWEAVIRRLSLSRGRILLTTTPYNLGWLKQEVVDQEDGISIEVVNFPSIDNPSFSKEEFEDRREKMETWKFNMFYRGIFERPPGMIFGDYIDDYWENGGHLVAPFDLPLEWARYVGVDPGANNTALIWLAHDPIDNIYYLYRESLDGGKSTPEHAKGAQQLAIEKGERVVSFQVGQKSESQQRFDWQAAGIPNVKEPPIHDVESGIDKIIQLFREFRLYIFDTCRGTRDQLGRYSRKVEPDGTVTDVIKDKQKFHYIDALRYDVVGVVLPTPTRPTSLAVVAKRTVDKPSRDNRGIRGMIAPPSKRGRQ